MSVILLGLSAALAAAVLVVAGVVWQRQPAGERRLSPVAIGCVLLCAANLLVALHVVAGPS